MTVSEKFLPLFVRYNVNDNSTLEKFCTNFIPEKSDGLNSGIRLRGRNIRIGDPFVREENPGEALKCLSDFFMVKVDSIDLQPDFYLYENPNKGERGIFTLLDISELSTGKHDIYIQKKTLNKNEEFSNSNYTQMVFWKE